MKLKSVDAILRIKLKVNFKIFNIKIINQPMGAL
jgi:hypothetical protein